MRVHPWADIRLETPYPQAPLSVDGVLGDVGFLPVYKTREAADAAWPGADILECKRVEGKDGE